jgi:hypothetical protein
VWIKLRVGKTQSEKTLLSCRAGGFADSRRATGGRFRRSDVMRKNKKKGNTVVGFWGCVDRATCDLKSGKCDTIQALGNVLPCDEVLRPEHTDDPLINAVLRFADAVLDSVKRELEKIQLTTRHDTIKAIVVNAIDQICTPKVPDDLPF